DVDTGNSTAPDCAIPSYTQIFGDFMVRLAEANDRIVAVTAAMPEGTGLATFAERFPERFFDVGIAEQHGVTFAAGLAAEGYRPVVAIYSTFLQRAYDQIIHDVCIEGLPVIFAIDRGGLVGEDGPTHHGQFDISYLRNLPNMVVMAPKDENELCRMLTTAVYHDGPIAIRYPRGTALGVPLDDPVGPIAIGQAEIICQGDDLLILAVGRMVQEAMIACRALAAEGIHCTLVNCRFVKPLDEERIVPLAGRIPLILTLEENVLQGGFGSAVTEMLCERHIAPVLFKKIGLPDCFIEHGAQAALRATYGLDAGSIERTILEMVAAAKPSGRKLNAVAPSC
ncbi:MAG: 1-deoxy-D-xylulose-5-phosphate synthase, partial [Desulfatitalea sp.]|nr:1-deoxy-D-xylulose-5-phosphate synthase [Desulfatitalea sp.]